MDKHFDKITFEMETRDFETMVWVKIKKKKKKLVSNII